MKTARSSARTLVDTDREAALESVTKVYPGQHEAAVDDLSLSLRPGEFFSLLGPSGCGKTTTLRILAGLEPPTSGRVLIRDADVTHTPANRRPTNMVFQRLALFPHMTVSGNIAFGPRLQRLPSRQVRARVDELLETVRLPGFGHRYPHQLSGGQQQRVAIARALANRPALLLLDEPLASLDLKLRIQMQESLKEIQAESATTFVYVTHDQNEALTMSDRIAVMSGGRIEQLGTPADIYDRPATKFVASFIGDTNLVEGTYRDGHLHSGGFALAVPEPGSIASIRPERIHVAQPGGELGQNHFPGTIRQVTFLGSATRYRIDVDDGPQLMVQTSGSDRLQASWPTGSRVVCHVPSDAVVLVKPNPPVPEEREDSGV